MSGGGFCDIHGPFDPPHLVCPYCVLEQQDRQTYGSPNEAVTELGGLDAFEPPAPIPAYAPPPSLPAYEPPAPIPAYEPPPAAQPDSAGFIRQTFEAEMSGGVTEIIQRPRQTGEHNAAHTGGTGLMGYLIIKEPHEYRGACLPIQPNQSIGREGDVRWNDPKMSRQHARVTAEPPEDNPDGPPMFYLWPFGPTNPVFINGKAVRGATAVYENDEIRLGDTLFVLKVLAD